MPAKINPLLQSARREALAAIGLWAIAAAYTLTYCALYGYDAEAELTFVLGFPRWVFWGIVAPWTACTLASIALACFWYRDHDLDDRTS